MRRDSEYPVAKGHYKDYPDDWVITALGDLLKRIVKPVKVIPEHEYREIGIRSHGKGLFHKEPVKGSDLGNKSVFWIEVDCLVINIVFAWEQAVGITTDQEKGMIASHRFPMWQSKGNIDLHYLLKIFLTPFGRHLLELASPGGAGRNRTLGQDDFNKTPFCIPSNIKEQQKIVKILSTWDKVINLKEQLINEKRRQKKWLMQNLLTGKKRLPGFEGEWKKVRLVDVCNVVIGQSPDSKAYNKDGIGIPLIQGNTDCQNGFTQPRVGTTQITKTCDVGDIILTVRAPVGAVAIANQKACIGRGVSAICPKYNHQYMYQYLLSIEDKWLKVSQGSTFDAIGGNEIRKLRIIYPSIEEQTAIAEILSTADREIELHEKELDELKKQKKALMQLLLTGAVRVNIQEVC